MKQKLIISVLLMVFLLVVILGISCQSSNQAAQSSPRSTSAGSVSTANRTREPLYNGDGGRGIVIAVPTPAMQNNTRADSWMPQLFQDLITGDMARFSAMTVIDRSNEQMVLAEQDLSVSGYYSDNDYIRIGNLTNAQFIVTGNIQSVSGRYNVSFRINNTETNEIRASFNKPYTINDIESGLAAKEAVLELLFGLGIELTEAGERTLLAVQPVEARATANLARGMAAEKSDNIVESLAFFSDALSSNTTQNEANKHIQNIFNVIPTASIQERANYARTEKAKWDKIFIDLDEYMWRNLPIFVYDFSIVEDQIDIRQNRVTLTVKPGIKVVPNRTALLVYKTIVDNWIQITNVPENKDWINNVRMSRLADSGGPTGLFSLAYGYFSYTIGLYDDYGDSIANHRWYGATPGISINYYRNDSDRHRRVSNFQVLSQHRYYEDAVFRPIRFTVPLDKVTNTLTPKIEKITSSNTYQGMPSVEYQIMSVPEWQEWLSQQAGAR